MDLTGQTAVVTGGTKGIGRAVGESLARAGCSVVIAARTATDVEARAEVLGRIAGDPSRALGVPADVSDEEQVADLFARTVRAFGRVDIVVNAAGVLHRSPLVETSLADWQESLRVNLTGVFLCSREAVRHMRDQEPAAGSRGHIVQIVSGAGVHGWANSGAYAAAKHGVMGLSETLRAELGGRGIRVSSILPGMVDTDMTDLREFAKRKKLQAEDIAHAVMAVVGSSADVQVERMDVRHR